MKAQTYTSDFSPLQPNYFFNDIVNLSNKLNLQLENCKDLSDSELVIAIKKQSKQAYDELHVRYEKKLFIYIFHLVGNREETEDILQSVFLKTFKNIKRFDTDRKFSSWIYRIAHNEAVNFLKRKSKRYTISWEEVVTSKDKIEMATIDQSFSEKWAKEEVSKDIREALEKLPQKYQYVLELRYFREYSYEDIGKVLDKPVNTVGTLINRAKKKLLDAVSEQQK